MIFINIKKFNSSKNKILNSINTRNSIGLLSEKSVHSVLKEYLYEDGFLFEHTIHKKIADIFTGDKIIEIQTRNFNQLKQKLDVFLKLYPVTIVYPIIKKKTIVTISQETGEILREKTSPKKDNIYNIFNEFYKIKPYLNNENLNFHIIEITAKEYRLDLIEKKWRKTHQKLDIIPDELLNESFINSLNDIKKLIPDNLKENFTSKDLSKILNIKMQTAQNMLNVLFDLNLINRTGKIKNSFTYSYK